MAMKLFRKKLEFAIHGGLGLSVGWAWIVPMWSVVLLFLGRFPLLMRLIFSFPYVIGEARSHWNMLVVAGHRVNG
jgi:hypothetical protein